MNSPCGSSDLCLAAALRFEFRPESGPFVNIAVLVALIGAPVLVVGFRLTSPERDTCWGTLGSFVHWFSPSSSQIRTVALQSCFLEISRACLLLKFPSPLHFVCCSGAAGVLIDDLCA